MIVKLLVEGGDMKPGPAISQKLGPMGINIGEVIQQVNDTTKNFKGMKVPVELDVDAKTKQFKIEVSSPPVAEMIKKELEIEKASGDSKKITVGNLAIEQIIKIAETKYSNMLEKDFKSAVKSVVGTCVSLGVLVENKNAKDIEMTIQQGKYDKEIEQRKTDVPEEKKQKLNDYLAKIKDEQEAKIKAEQEAAAEKEAEEAEKKEEVAEGEVKPEGEAEEAAPTEEKPEEEAAEEKK